jgi:hypothetical protein
MRYRKLIIVLFIVATASFLWAEPSREVLAPNQRESLSEGWSIPNLTEPEAPPKPISLNNFSDEEFQLKLAVIPGTNLESTTFRVAFTGPAGFDLMRDGGSNVPLMVTLKDETGQRMLTTKLSKSGQNRWRFKGADLQGNGDKIEGACTFQVSTFIRDQNQSRFSRGARVITVESEPVRVAFR